MNQGLSESDFDHEAPAHSDSEASLEVAPDSVAAPKKGGKRVKTKKPKVVASAACWALKLNCCRVLQ